jgi:hypothetical protein
MTEIARGQHDAHPSGGQLLTFTAIALAIAAVILVTLVLPAEYGVDPTGIGQRLGLASLSARPAAKAAPEPGKEEPAKEAAKGPETALTLTLPAGGGTVWKASRPYRSDELSLTLRPNEGAEIKASMQQGERFVFTWVTDGGAVNFDMHGEEFNAPSDKFTSFWKGSNATSGHGEFQAPFAGTHGWFWRNRGTKPVTVTVRTSGFYEKLYRPK